MKKYVPFFLLTAFMLISCAKTDANTNGKNSDSQLSSSSIDENAPSLVMAEHVASVVAGKSIQLQYIKKNIEDNIVIGWQTFATDKVYVDKTGLVTGLSYGKDTVIAFADMNNNGQADSDEPMDYCEVTVTKAESGVTVSLNAGFAEIEMEHAFSVAANVDPAPQSGNYFYLSFSSSNPLVAVAIKQSDYNTNAIIKAVGLGEADITVSYASREAKMHVKVVPWIENGVAHVAGVSLEKDEYVLEKTSTTNPTYQLNPSFIPESATNKKVFYSSNNEKVATVSESGLITGLSGGNAIITVRSEDLNKTDTINIVVKDTSKNYTTGLYGGYYDDLTTWENGEDLIAKLHNIIKDDTPLKYDWDVIKSSDEAIDNVYALDTLYSAEEVLKTEQASGFSREHAFPASLMTGFTTGDAVAQKGRATDYHNLFAASVSGNSSRSNKNYGNAYINDPNYTVASDNSYSFDRLNFEPADCDKGKAARAIFYMATMYNEDVEANVTDGLTFKDDDPNKTGTSKTVHVIYTQKALQITDEYADYSKVSFTKFHYHEDQESQAIYDKYVTADTTNLDFNDLLDVETEAYGRYSTDNCKFSIGGLSDLLTWTSTTVSYAEYNRNNVVQAAQGNRNPFTDYPELINYAFGALKDQPGSLATIRPSEDILDTDSGNIIGYRITDYKQSAVVGDTYSPNDFTLVAVKSDLTTEAAAASANLFNSYTFTNDDLKQGFTYVEIPTTLNTIRIKVKVTEGDMSVCNYQYRLVGKTNKDWGNADLKDFVNGGTATFGALQWKISWTNDNASIGSTYAAAGVAFGTGTNAVGTITFETIESLTNVEAFFALVNAASNKTPTYEMYIGSTLVKSGSYTGSGNNADPTMVGSNFTAMTGKVKIVISGASNYAVHMHTLALKY